MKKILLLFLLLNVLNSQIVFAQEFITTWQTTSNNESITIPTAGALYSYTVDWGDGSIDATVYTGAANHVYTSAGTYTVSISGTFPWIYFNNGGDKNKIQTIEQWGNIAWTSMNNAFHGCTQLTYNATDAPDLSGVTDMGSMFRSASNFNGNIDNWDVSTVFNMSFMFFGATNFNQNIGSWNVSMATNMSSMFRDAVSFNGDIGPWDVGAVTNMLFMFRGATAFNQNIGNWDVSAVTNMSEMFKNTSNFNQDIGSWNVSNVTNMTEMFRNATVFNQDINSWDTGSVTVLTGMFADAVAFNQSIGNWDVSAVTNMSIMFLTAATFDQNINNWDVSSVLNMEGMFNGASAFNQDLSGWDMSNVLQINGMFSGATDFNQDIDSWDVSAVTGMSVVFADATAFNQDISNWNVSAVTNMSFMFFNATAFNQSLGNWDISAVNNMSNMFTNIGMTTTNYDNTLIGWSTLDAGEAAIPTGISLGATGLLYCNSITERDELINTYSWTISGDVNNCPPVPDVTTLADLIDCTTITPSTPTATDPEDGQITSVTSTTFPINTPGITNIEWTYTNSNGNVVVQNQQAAIGSSTEPVPDAALLPDVISATPITSITAPTATDGCGNTVTATTNVVFPISSPQTIAWAFTDAVGNTSTQYQYVMIGSPFITTWNTLTNGQILTIPTLGAGYSYKVDWGDGSIDATVYTGDATHPYTTAGTYTLSISGAFPRIFFNGTGDRRRIQSIEQWGDIEWTSMASAFKDCLFSSYNATDAPDLSSVTDLSGMFLDARSFNGDIGSWDVSTITNMSSMFESANNFNNSIDSWDVSAVTNMSKMFYSAEGFNQNIDSWDVSAVTNMAEMFSGSSAFNQNIGSWDVSAVTNMAYMFESANSFNQDIGSWDVSAVTDMSNMFIGAIFNQDIGNWDVSAVTNMSMMFGAFPPSNLTPFNQDISSWDVSSVLNMSDMFLNSAFNQDIGGWNVSNLTNMSEMFAFSAFDQDLSGWDISAATNMSYMFSKANMSSANYDNTLIGWSTLSVGESAIPIGITLDADLYYCNSVTERAELINTYSWTINGDVNSCPPVADVATLADLIDCTSLTPTAPTATDPVDGQITGTTNATFPITTPGTMQITWKYENLAGNYSMQTQNIFIGDDADPVPDETALADVTTECPVASITAPTATDNCAGSVTGTTATTFPITAQGTTVVTWTFTDDAGNEITQNQNVIIEDVTAPVADETALVDVTGECSVDSITAPTATDNCSGSITGTTDATFPITAQGTTVVTWTYTDDAGNESVQVQNVMIDCVTGIDDLLVDLTLYPNPSRDVIQFNGKNSERIEEVELYDMNGAARKLVTMNPGHYDISSLPSGTYLVRIRLKNETKDFRLIKE